MEYINTRKVIFFKSLFCALKQPFRQPTFLSVYLFILIGASLYEMRSMDSWSYSILQLNKYEIAPYFFLFRSGKFTQIYVKTQKSTNNRMSSFGLLNRKQDRSQGRNLSKIWLTLWEISNFILRLIACISAFKIDG